MEASQRARRGRVRMTAAQRREQLIDVSRALFADKGLDGTSVEEIAAAADVSKPVVYEHFGGKEGLYAVVVDREVRHLSDAVRAALTTPGASSRELLEHATMALLDYIETRPDGFRIASRDSGPGQPHGSFASIISDIASRVEDLMVSAFEAQGLDVGAAPLYAQALVGMVAMSGQWWLDDTRMPKEDVAAHLVNLAWHGMKHLESSPGLRIGAPRAQARPDAAPAKGLGRAR